VIALLALFIAIGGGTAFALVGANQVNSQSIIDGEVKNQDLGASSVGTGKVIDHSLTANDLANGAVGAGQLAPDSVDSSKVADGSLTGADLANLAVDTPQLQDLSVVGSKLADGAVDTAKLADGAVNSAKLADNAVTSRNLRAFSVSGIKILPGAVGSRAIADNSIRAADIQSGSIGDRELVVQPGASVASQGQVINTTSKCATLGFPSNGATFDHGQLFAPATNNTVLTIPRDGIYLVTAAINWVDDSGIFTASVRKGSTVIASGNAHDGDDQTVSGIVPLSHGDRVNARVCWSGFGSSRTVANGSTLAVQWLAGLFEHIPVGPRAAAR
jgi:hypothetical protein